ncbi:MAG: hypothetical protein F6K56_43195 [Moorea sp. SIO3G5]|nr:hypothetical protein [Moorena sp. SIO3G5]
MAGQDSIEEMCYKLPNYKKLSYHTSNLYIQVDGADGVTDGLGDVLTLIPLKLSLLLPFNSHACLLP